MPKLLKNVSRLADRLTFLILASITLGCGVATLWLTRSFSPLRGDSPGYLYFDPTRTVGYPAFLEVVRLVGGRIALAVPLQMLILAISLIWLGWSFHRLVRRPAWTIAFQLLLVANAGMWFASAFLMSEALSTAAVALWVAAAVRVLRQPDTGFRELVVIPCLAITIRPSLLPLFAGSALLARRDCQPLARMKTLIVMGAGLVAAWAATPISQLLVHGSTYTTSPFARGVLQHTLYCGPGANPRGPDAEFVEAAASRARSYIDSAPGPLQEQLRREYSRPLRFGVIIPALGVRHHLEFGSEVDPYLVPIAEQRVLANPGCYVKSVANEYVRLAVFDTDPTSAEAREVNAFIEHHPPVEFAEYPVLPGDDHLARRAASEVHRSPTAGINPRRQKLHVAGDVPMIALLPFRLLYAAAALIGALGVIAWLGRRWLNQDLEPFTRAGASLGLSLHGILLITAIVEIGFYRYLVPCWPMACALIAVTPFAIARRARTPTSGTATIGR